MTRESELFVVARDADSFQAKAHAIRNPVYLNLIEAHAVPYIKEPLLRAQAQHFHFVPGAGDLFELVLLWDC
ncbi:MAG: hypothetical protein H0X34_17910 [Chthoniobacterales bacterium]|nr:hypothetical protein [Chthoniobacterales bacterium]